MNILKPKWEQIMKVPKKGKKKRNNK
jgi:hypothetical protein